MFQNYLKTALRNLAKNKVFSVINIMGLAIGLACCLLILLYTKDEVSYDRFHEKKDRIYRITTRMVDKNGKEAWKGGKTGMMQGPILKKEIPEIDDFVRVQEQNLVVKKGKEVFNEKILYVDDNFFSVFSFPLISGQPEKVLTALNSLVLSDETAKKYFGAENPIGKTLELQMDGKFEPFVISGLAKNSPQNSSIKFNFLLPFRKNENMHADDNWLSFFLSTFLVLHAGTNAKELQGKMTQVLDRSGKEQIADARVKYNFQSNVIWGLQPFLEMHLSADYQAIDELAGASDPVYSYILTAIAFFILFIACINFVNLTLSNSIKRSKEIGIRKVMGGRWGQLVRQFLGESLVQCFIAFVLAILLALAILPVFNEAANKELSLDYLLDTQLISGFIGLFLLTGFAAGLYPAFVLSGYNPVQALYSRTKLTGRNYLTKGLVIVQFALTAIMIITTLFMYYQFDFMAHTELGYNDKNLVVIDLGGSDNKKLVELLKTGLAGEPSLQVVGAHNRGRRGTNARLDDGKEMGFDYERIDENYFPALQIPIISGRNFSRDFPSDSTHSVMVNESFVTAAGWKDAVGKQVDLFWENRKLTVIGVVRDFHHRSLKEKIGPQLFTTEPEFGLGQLFIRIKPGNASRTLASIERTYRKFLPFYPFKFDFKDDTNARQYKAEEKWKQIISLSAVLAIFISCMGLFGLVTLSAEKRTKEIGIRKVLGASISNIVQLFSNDFLRLVLIANIIAFPVAWYTTHSWLENFAYRININAWVFVVAAMITLFIALFTIGTKAIRAAMANPVKNLRSE